jgi:prepilin-type N-terminal cleavage/methylation domain-containing protein
MFHKPNEAQGFTLVELMFAMAFVAVLLVFIALTVIQISNIYSKGMTMKDVNEAGLAISNDIRQTIGQSQPFDPTLATTLCLQDSKGHCPTANVTKIIAGRLCTGTYDYIWNNPASLALTVAGKPAPVNAYSQGSDLILFARVRDSGGTYCATPSLKINETQATELLSNANGSSKNGDLAVESFSLTQLASDPIVGQALYRIVMEVGTSNQAALIQSQPQINTINTNCSPPSNKASQENYCAVNQFDFTAEAGNEGSSSS